MVFALLFIILLLGLTVVFSKAAEWFDQSKGINIVPASLVNMVAEIILVYQYTNSENDAIKMNLWIGIAIIIFLTIIIMNLMKYGLKDGIFASLAEIVFSISAVIIIIGILLALISQNTSNGSRRKRK